MELTIDTFNKGLANRIRPHLLPEGFCQSVRDADIVDGSLRPFNGTKKVSFTGPRLTYQNDAGTRSLEKWGDYWYWSDNDTGEIGSSIGYVGVLPPTTHATAKPEVEGDRFKGDYQYLFTFETANGYESSAFGLTLSLEDAVLHVKTSHEITIPTEGAELFNPSNQLTSNRKGYNGGVIVTYEGQLYQATHTFSATYQNTGETPRHIAIQEWQYPNAVTGDQFWLSLGDVNKVQVAGYQRIHLQRIPQPTESSANKINVYRTASGGSNYYLVATLGVGSLSYIDEMPDSVLISNRALALDYTFPPLYENSNDATNSLQKIGGYYLTEQNGTFYLANGDRVYLSEAGNPHAWNPNHYVELGDTVTAIAREDRGVVAMTRNRTYHITGTTVADISSRWVPNFQGCPNWRTVNYLHDVPVWLSNDGITVFGYEPNINVERLQVLTEAKHSFPDDITHAAVANDIYYLFRPDGTAICVDFRRELAIYERSLAADFAIADDDADRLLLRYKDETYEVDGGDALTWTWRSAELPLTSRSVGPNELKKIRSVYVTADADFSLRVFADGGEELQLEGKVGGRASRRVYTRGIFCRHLTLEIECAGEVRHISIEYFPTQKQR